MENNKNELLSEVLSIVGNTDTSDMVDSASSTSDTSIITSDSNNSDENYIEVTFLNEPERTKIFKEFDDMNMNYREAKKYHEECLEKMKYGPKIYVENGDRTSMTF